MKKMVFAFGALVAISMLSCTGRTNPDDDGEKTDTIVMPVDTALQVTGVAIDGATNSISLLVGEDTLYFEFTDLGGDHKDSWYINDTVTVRYFVNQGGDRTVTDVINETDA